MSRSKWTFIILYFPIATWSQQCFNAGLETATLDGYATYLGRIRADGQVIIQDPGSNPERHRVMHISEGVDPIAQTYCTLNSQMPVVAPGGGQYALRLGNSRGWIGSRKSGFELYSNSGVDLLLVALRSSFE